MKTTYKIVVDGVPLVKGSGWLPDEVYSMFRQYMANYHDEGKKVVATLKIEINNMEKKR